MENASRALIMAAGILIGILILGLTAIMFLHGREVFSGYEETKTSEMVQRFNSNFIKYTGQKLTAHQVLTIYNFARKNNVQVVGVTVPSNDFKNTTQMSTDVGNYNELDPDKKLEKYKLTITGYTTEGYVNAIKVESI